MAIAIFCGSSDADDDDGSINQTYLSYVNLFGSQGIFK